MLLAATSTFAQAVFQETQLSFGEVDVGTKVTHAFVFRNAGQTELHVKAVTPT